MKINYIFLIQNHQTLKISCYIISKNLDKYPFSHGINHGCNYNASVPRFLANCNLSKLLNTEKQATSY